MIRAQHFLQDCMCVQREHSDHPCRSVNLRCRPEDALDPCAQTDLSLRWAHMLLTDQVRIVMKHGKF